MFSSTWSPVFVIIILCVSALCILAGCVYFLKKPTQPALGLDPYFAEAAFAERELHPNNHQQGAVAARVSPIAFRVRDAQSASPLGQGRRRVVSNNNIFLEISSIGDGTNSTKVGSDV